MWDEVKAYYLSIKDGTPNSDYWDMGILDNLDCEKENVSSLPRVDKAIVVIPARHHAGLEQEINGQLRKIKKVVLFLMGDEEASFDVSQIKHSDIYIWVQNARPPIHDQYFKLGTGYPPQSQTELKKHQPNKRKTVFFAGQITHSRRQELQRVIEHYNQELNGKAHFYPSEGFTQGLNPETYYTYMSEATIVPAPSGAVIPDSFRLFEALESMAIPIADTKCPDGTIYQGYWDWLFGEIVPFPMVDDWNAMPSVINEIIADYPSNLHKQTSWWIKWKRNFRYKVMEQLNCQPDEITVIIPTSIIPSHPSTDIIEETIASIRHHLPKAEIILQIDGLREEQTDRKKDYDRYKTKVLWNCLHKWENVTPVIFDEMNHQTSMLKATIDMVKTPLLLYVEADTPLVTDEPIEWDLCIEKIKSGEANTVRFHHEGEIPREHEGLMLGKEGKFTKTYQWSQRPHLSSVVYYRDILMPTLPDKTFIEDGFHGVVQQDWYRDSEMGWFKHRLWIYTPEGNIKRSYHLDGRAGTRKFTSDDEAWGLI